MSTSWRMPVEVASAVSGCDEHSSRTTTWQRVANTGHVGRICRNVKRRSASIVMRRTAAAMQEAAKGF
jgi:hypothetical protein